MEEATFEDLQMFATEDVLAEDLPATGALGSWGSAGTFASTVGGCASSCSTASTFS